MNIYMVDDEPHGMRLLSAYLKNIPGHVLLGMETESIIASEKILSGEIKPDVVFVDIDMPGLNGVDLTTLIKGLTLVVFTTGHRDYGPEAFKHNVVDYLMKPIKFEVFLECLEKVKARLATAKTNVNKINYDQLPIPGSSKGTYHVLETKDIVYIQAVNTYVNIFMSTDKKRHMTNYSIQEIEELLSPQSFVRIHRSYIVNIKYIERFDPKDVFMKGGFELPISDTHRKALMKAFKP